MYYFGDVEVPSWVLKGGINSNCLSYGGALSIRYLIPQDRHFNMRFSLGAGKLNGNNSYVISKIKNKSGNLSDKYRRFDSWYIQPSVGVEMFPTLKAGLYFYTGVALTASFIYKFEEGTVTLNEKGKTVENPSFKNDSTWSFLPMVQLGIGYSFRLSDSWSLSVEAMGQIGVCDVTGLNLDGWPYDDNPHRNNKFSDGWFQLGVTVTYRWQNCQQCRLNKNEKGTRGGSRYSTRYKNTTL